jgi:hypothetical protein
MVTRTNGAPRQGVWFSSDVVFVSVTVTGTTTFLTDLTVAATGTTDRQADVVNSDLEQVIEILNTRGTVIGMTVESDLIAHFMVDYGQAFDPDNVALGNQTAQDINAEIDAAIVAIGATVTSVVVATERGFSPLALGVPA